MVEQISLVSFRIKLPQSKIGSGLHDVFHVRNLLVDKPNAKSILPPEKFESTMNEQEYEMHSVITHDKHGKQNRFLIRWKNWPEALATWISEAVFRADAPDMLAEYMKAHNKLLTDKCSKTSQSASVQRGEIRPRTSRSVRPERPRRRVPTHRTPRLQKLLIADKCPKGQVLQRSQFASQADCDHTQLVTRDYC